MTDGIDYNRPITLSDKFGRAVAEYSRRLAEMKEKEVKAEVATMSIDELDRALRMAKCEHWFAFPLGDGVYQCRCGAKYKPPRGPWGRRWDWLKRKVGGKAK